MKRFFAVLLVVSFLFFCGCNGENTASVIQEQKETSSVNSGLNENEPIKIDGNEFTVSEKTVRFIGRHHVSTQTMAYGFYNPAAGICFDFTGSSAEIHLSASEYSEYNVNYVAVYIDGADQPISIRVEKDGWYKLCDNLDPNIRHTVKLLKRSMTNAGAVYAYAVRLSEGASLYRSPSTHTHKIQVIGDSITSGYGLLWDQVEQNEVTMFQSGDHSYATMLADKLDADLEVVAVSGGGVGNIENKPSAIINNYKQEDMVNGVDCDFSKFVPEVVVIALGTNDIGQNNPADTFKINSMRLIEFIREQYPDSVIVWTYGVMGGVSYKTVISEMIETVNKKGDKNVYFLPLDSVQENELPIGQHGHPGIKTHERMAEKLSDFIIGITGWGN